MSYFRNKFYGNRDYLQILRLQKGNRIVILGDKFLNLWTAMFFSDIIQPRQIIKGFLLNTNIFSKVRENENTHC